MYILHNHALNLLTLIELNLDNYISIINLDNYISTRNLDNCIRIKLFSKVRNFSTSNINYKKSLSKDLKREVIADMKEYDADNPRPVHVNPGYPNMNKVAAQSSSKTEFDNIMDRFANRNSVQFSLQEHDQDCKRHIVQKWGEKHPEVPSHKLGLYIDKKQETQYVRDDDHADFGINKKESSWLGKFWDRAFDAKDKVQENEAEVRFRRGGSSSDSALGSNQPLSTPSVGYPASKTDSSNTFPSEASSSSSEASSSINSSKNSNIDYVMEKESCEMPGITEADGGGD